MTEVFEVKKSWLIPCEDALHYPNVNEVKQIVANFCAHEGFSYEFTGVNEAGDVMVVINGIPHEALRRTYFGGYGITCRER